MLQKILFIASFVVLSIGVFLENNSSLQIIKKQNINEYLSKELQKREIEQIEISQSIKLYQIFTQFDINSDYVKQLKERNYDIFVYKDASLIFWTNNTLSQSDLIKTKQNGTSIIKTKNGYYQLVKHSINGYSIYCSYHIFFQYPFKNEYFQNGFSHDLNLGKIQLTQETFDKNDSIATLINFPKINHAEFTQQAEYNFANFLYFLSFLIFLVAIFLQSISNSIFKINLFIILISIYGLLIILLTYANIIFKDKGSSIIFSPEVAAYSSFVPSLGHCLLLTLGVNLLLLIIHQLIRSRQRKMFDVKKHYVTASILIWALIYFILIACFPSFVFNSQINYDFSELSNVDFLTIIGMTTIFGMFLCIVIGIRIISHITNHQYKKSIFILLHFNIGLLIALMCFLYKLENGFLLICVSLLSILCCYLVLFPNKLKAKHIIALSVLFAAYFAIHFNQLNNRKEQEYRKIFSKKFIDQEDFENEMNLSLIEKEMIRENVFSKFYNYPKNDYNELELNYKYTFFNDYIKNYDIDFMRFDANGKDVTSNKIPFNIINDIYNKSSNKSVANYFLFINELNYLGGYLAKYEICPGKITEGYVFVILIPKVKSDLYNLDYFFNKKVYSLNLDNQYSYAVYQNNLLVKGIGSYPFKLSDNKNYKVMSDASFFDSDEFSHLLKKIDANTFLIVSKKAESWVNKIGVFTFIFLFFVTLILFGIFIMYLLSILLNIFKTNRIVSKVYVAIQKKLRIININKLYLETKIRIAFVLLAVFICSVVTYFTVQNVNNSFNDKQNAELDKKMSQIVNEIEIGYQKQNDFSLNTLIKHLSNSYEVDINLYNTKGELTESGNTRIYNEGWFSKVMNPVAYQNLAKNNAYSFKQNETIGKLNYISNYNALFDENRNLIGYVHLPFFSQSIDLKKEFSKYLGDLLNITTLLMIISLLIATYAGRSLVRPLKIMINSLSQMKVGSQNKPIEWHQNDEIGQLVEQYNNMLKKLELSTEKLAQSEREGAWKEMAKQVAHEIKNPLTPMKLHLQHLQLSISRNDENLIPKIKNISQMLIDQIEHLSNMAEEFSSFAKMPIAVLELIDINTILNSSIHLFNSQSNVTINFKTPHLANMVYIDKGQIQRVFTNILKNAQQAAIEDLPCIINISVEKIEKNISISFKDNGKGIEAELKDKIFTPNFSTKTSGMGLGLSICKKIVESFNGTIYFESEINNGAIFYVVLPIIEQ